MNLPEIKKDVKKHFMNCNSVIVILKRIFNFLKNEMDTKTEIR